MAQDAAQVDPKHYKVELGNFSERRSALKRSILCITVLALLFAEQGLGRAATLFGVTGDGAATPETLFILSQSDASATFLLPLGAGGDGETIGFNPNDGLMYHASGISYPDQFFESIDLTIPAVVSTNLLSDFADEVSGMTYNPATGTFLVSSLFHSNLYSVALNGVATIVGNIGARLKGLAYVGATLYGVTAFEDKLHTINPLTGAILTTVTLTLPGFTVNGANGLATNPDTGELWAVLRLQNGSRHLVIINPITGVATDIGTLGDNFAGIAFGDECPDSDLSATVVIDGCNSGVPNTLFPSGCTISDLIAECAEGASNHGQFVSCVSHLTNDLKKAGSIIGQQKGAIQSCAAKAHIP